jgi:hypothetical protein
MKFKILAGLLGVSALLAYGVAFAKDPDLRGTWEAVDGVIRTTSGKDMSVGATSRLSVVIDSQNGAVFSGTYGWKHPETMQEMNDGKEVTHTAVENFIGVLHADRRTVTFVDHPDTGMFLGQLVAEDTIEIVIYESGPYAIAGRLTLVRQ